MFTANYIAHTLVLHNLFTRLGVMPMYRGYNQCICAVLLCLEDPERLQLVTKTLFPDVAKRFKVASGCVERNIRTVVSIAWSSNPELISELAGYDLAKCPTASQFISLLVLYIKNQEMQLQEKPMLPASRETPENVSMCPLAKYVSAIIQ